MLSYNFETCIKTVILIKASYIFLEMNSLRKIQQLQQRRSKIINL